MIDEYNTDSDKWEAYQFTDPFANDSFLILNRKLWLICRPSCDYYPKVDKRDDVQFINPTVFNDPKSTSNTNDYLSKFTPCNHCQPFNDAYKIDLPLVEMTINAINNSIGFTSDSNDLKRRAYSLPSNSIHNSSNTNERQLTRNESEHIKLVELACRHIATAAATSISKQAEESKFDRSSIQSETGSISPSSAAGSATAKDSKKKRRGGVLGFKELASKSKLSPWHFHRVFKSVTGLTPKAYGDQCWKFIKNHGHPQTKRQRANFKSLESNYSFRPKRASRQQQDQQLSASPTSTPASSSSLSSSLSMDSSPSKPSSSSNTVVSATQAAQQPPSPLPIGQEFNQLNQPNYELFNHHMNTINANNNNNNYTQFRHNSITIGSQFDSILIPRQQYFTQSNNNSHLQLQQLEQLQQLQQQQEQAQPQQLQQPIIAENDAELITSSNDIIDISLNNVAIDENEWPSIETATPDFNTTSSSSLLTSRQGFNNGESKLLTPPSTAATESNDFLQDLDNSPLNYDGELNLGDYNYKPINSSNLAMYNNNSGDLVNNSNGLNGDDLFGADGYNDIFDQITTLNTSKNLIF